jgi:hypothetical protein
MALPTWIPHPNAKDQWLTIARLRDEAAAVLSQNEQTISPPATQLHHDDH